MTQHNDIVEEKVDDIVHDLEVLDFNSKEARAVVRQALQAIHNAALDKAVEVLPSNFVPDVGGFYRNSLGSSTGNQSEADAYNTALSQARDAIEKEKIGQSVKEVTEKAMKHYKKTFDDLGKM